MILGRKSHIFWNLSLGFSVYGNISEINIGFCEEEIRGNEVDTTKSGQNLISGIFTIS